MEPGRACPTARRLAPDHQCGRDRQIRPKPPARAANGEAFRRERRPSVHRSLESGGTEMNAAVQKKTMWTSIGRMFAGALVGGIATFLFIEFVGERFMDLDNGAVMLTVMAGLVYALIGLSVAFGLLAP